MCVSLTASSLALSSSPAVKVTVRAAAQSAGEKRMALVSRERPERLTVAVVPVVTVTPMATVTAWLGAVSRDTVYVADSPSLTVRSVGATAAPGTSGSVTVTATAAAVTRFGP